MFLYCTQGQRNHSNWSSHGLTTLLAKSGELSQMIKFTLATTLLTSLITMAISSAAVPIIDLTDEDNVMFVDGQVMEENDATLLSLAVSILHRLCHIA